MIHIRARFRTHELAMRTYVDLEMAVHVDLPTRDEEGGGYPWVLDIAYEQAQQALVLAKVGEYGGVTFRVRTGG